MVTAISRPTILALLAVLSAAFTTSASAQAPRGRIAITPTPATLALPRAGWQAGVASRPDSLGHNAAIQGAIVGGATLGVLTGFVAWSFCASDSHDSCAGSAIGGVLLGATVGAVLGGMLASL